MPKIDFESLNPWIVWNWLIHRWTTYMIGVFSLLREINLMVYIIFIDQGISFFTKSTSLLNYGWYSRAWSSPSFFKNANFIRLLLIGLRHKWRHWKIRAFDWLAAEAEYRSGWFPIRNTVRNNIVNSLFLSDRHR